jgi:hypothetical protein
VTGVLFLEGEDYSLCYNIQTSSGAQPTFYPVCTGALFSGVKLPGHEANTSPPHSSKVKKVWSCTSTSHMSTGHGAWLSPENNFSFIFMGVSYHLLWKCNVLAGHLLQHKWNSRGSREGYRILAASVTG